MNMTRPVCSTLVHRVLAAGAAALLCVCPGCVTVSPEGITLLKSANSDYESSRWNSAESQAALFIQKYHNSPVVAEAYYVRGMARYQQQQFAGAEADFQLAVANSKRADLTAKAHNMLGQLALQRDDAAAAVPHLRAAAEGMPEGNGKPELYYRLAIALRRAGQWDEARPYLSRVVDGYPTTEYARYARKQLDWHWRGFSIQCGVFRQSKNAQQEMTRLRQAGLDARQEMMRVGNEPQYVILVGQYATYREAKNNLRRVRMHVRDAIVMP